jgi:uncharacterized protein (TIGR02646 family)
MRYIVRDAALSPEELKEPSFRRELKQVFRAAQSDEQVRADLYRLSKHVQQVAHNAVREQFRKKCAYCELDLNGSEGVIDWFRPLFGAEREDGLIDPHHYMWLTAEWGNLYWCCAQCHSRKRNLFPTSLKASFGDSVNQLRRQDEAILIDPCHDRPEKYFRINSQGELQPRDESRRASVTIGLLSLNRYELCAARRRALDQFIRIWNEQLERFHRVSTQHFGPIYEVLDHNAPFVGSIYLFLIQLSKAMIVKKTVREMIRNGPTDSIIRFLIPRLGPLTHVQLDLETQTHTLATPNIEHYEPTFRPIESVQILNFKGIEDLTIQFSQQNAHSLAIVGENAAGKTSVLQAIALGLAGVAEANMRIKDARQVLSNGVEEGKIVVKFVDTHEANELRFSRRTKRFYGETPHLPRVFGYGPFRLLSKTELPISKRGKRVRLTSLFNEGSALNGHRGWLDSLNEAQRSDLAEVLQLLLVSDQTKITVNPNSLVIRTNGREHPIGSLSSGMQSVVAMCTDLMESLYQNSHSVLSDGYFILIDELDAHLHPAWRLGILPRLKRAFPNAQIVFSTHDPLTLRGMESSQVHVLVRDAMGGVKEVLARYSDGQSIDQVLTSPMFGLFSTKTRDWEAQFNQYVALLLKSERNPLSKSEMATIEQLKEELNGYHVLGDTQRERLAFAIVDRYLATLPRQAVEWDDEVIAELADVLKETINRRAAND